MKVENNSQTNFIDYIERYYEIKRNLYTNEINIIRKRDNKQINKYDLILEAEQYGISLSKRKLDYFFKSNYVKNYDPYQEWFSSLSWTPIDESHIKKLLNYIQFSKPDFAKKFLYKWLINSVKQILGKGLNDVMLLFVSNGKQGIGKTFLCEQLLKNIGYIKTGQSLMKNYENLPEAAVFYPFIFYDEMKGLKKESELLLFKTIISSSIIEYRKFSKIYRRRRLANFIGTADSSSLLFDPSGARRFAILEIEKINFNYLQNVNFQKIWAEAFYIAKNEPEKYQWTQQDYETLDQNNANYYRFTGIEFWIQKFFSPANNYKSYELYSSSEIYYFLMEKIPHGIIQRFRPEHIGFAMKKLGFRQVYDKKGNKRGRYYLVYLKI